MDRAKMLFWARVNVVSLKIFTVTFLTTDQTGFLTLAYTPIIYGR